MPAAEGQDKIPEIIGSISRDSLSRTIRVLSGEDSILLGGQKVLIRSRANTSPGNSLAEDYIKTTLYRYGLQVADIQYSTDGHNVTAKKPGKRVSDSIYIICAHYDAVKDYAADDNASGVAAVLEAARILAKYSFDYSVIFGFWDQEESGMLGSYNYAQQASANNLKIGGVINVDMIGYDQNDDRRYELHLNTHQPSLLIRDELSKTISRYNLQVVQEGYEGINAISASDHSSFWKFGFGAVLMLQNYLGGESDPYYHTTGDRYSNLNMGYITELTRLFTAAAASLLKIQSLPTSVNEDYERGNIYRERMKIYPNPSGSFVNIDILDFENKTVDLEIYNPAGLRVSKQQIVVDSQIYSINYDVSSLKQGFYIVKVKDSNVAFTRKLVICK